MKHLKLFFFAMLITGSTHVMAQQTTFGVPNAEVTDDGKFYFQLNAFLHSEVNITQLNAMYGVYKNTDVGVNYVNLSVEDDAASGFMLSAKHKETLNADHNLSIGANYFINSKNNTILLYGLVTANKLLPKANINIGLYYISNFDSNFGLMASMDYPVINDKIRVKGEYMSGENIFWMNGLKVGGQYEISKNMLAGLGVTLVNPIKNYSPVVLQFHYKM